MKLIKKQKKRFVTLLSVCFVTSLCVAACSNNQATDTELNEITEISELSTTASEEISETEAEKVQISQRDMYLNYLQEELVPKYGLADMESSMKGDSSEEDWAQFDGLISAKIEDLDGDGDDELLISRIESGITQLYSGRPMNQIIISLYTIENDNVICSDEVKKSKYIQEYDEDGKPIFSEDVLGFVENCSFANFIYMGIVPTDVLGKAMVLSCNCGTFGGDGFEDICVYTVKNKKFVMRYYYTGSLDGTADVLFDENGEISEYEICGLEDEDSAMLSLESVGIKNERPGSLYIIKSCEDNMNFMVVDNIPDSKRSMDGEPTYYCYVDLDDYTEMRKMIGEKESNTNDGFALRYDEAVGGMIIDFFE